MEDIFGIKADIDSLIKLTENYLNNLKQIKKEKGNVVFNPNYMHLINKIFNSPDVMMFRR